MKNVLKKALVVLLAVTLLIPATVASAAPSPAKADIKKTTVTATSKTYNGKKQATTVTVKAADGTVLKKGKDYKVSGTTKATNAGKYKVKITGIGVYQGTTTATFQINKAAQKITAKKLKESYEASSLKKKAASFTISGIKGKAKVKYEEKGDYKKITVSKSGKVTLKKGLKKGTYKITVSTEATKNYKPTKKVITIKVK